MAGYNIETGCDEQPDLVHHERRRKHHPGHECHAHLERERFAWADEHQLRAGGQHPVRGLEDEIDNSADEEERDEHAGGNADAAPNQAFPQLVQVLEKPHRRIVQTIIGLLRSASWSGCHHEDGLQTHWRLAAIMSTSACACCFVTPGSARAAVPAG